MEKEKQIEMGRDDLSGKPEQIKEKIVEGRIAKDLMSLFCFHNLTLKIVL